jgi:hypothetical protein
MFNKYEFLIKKPVTVDVISLRVNIDIIFF